ncbi:MAG: ABC transporter transmembrane domain-containing protein, partial [Anaerolineales bacterium]
MLTRTDDRRRARAAAEAKPETAASLTSVNWKRLLGYLRPYLGQMALALLALLVSTGLGLSFPLVVVRLLDTVTQAKTTGPLNLLAGILAGVFLLQAAFQFVQSYLLAVIGEKIVYDLRTSLYNHLQALSLDFYAGRRVGEIVSRLSSDVTQMRTMLTSNITSLLSQVVTLVGALAIVLT